MQIHNKRVLEVGNEETLNISQKKYALGDVHKIIMKLQAEAECFF